MSIMNLEALKRLNCVMHWTGQVATAQTPKSITANGNVTQILPFPGAGIGMFDGTGDYLTISDHADFNFGSSNFTIEFWLQPNVVNVGQGIIAKRLSSTTDYAPFIFTFASGAPATPTLYMSTSGSAWEVSLTSSVAFTARSQKHVAIVRNGTTVTLYIDGVNAGSSSALGSSALMVNTSALCIAKDGVTSGAVLNGNLSEIRFSNIARYTTAFTPPKRQLESDSNTKLLLHFQANNATFVDSSPSPKTITAYGDAKQLCSPCGSGVAKFDGYDDRLTIASSSDFAFGTGDFTIRVVFYIAAIETGHLQWILDMRTADTDVAIELILHELGVISVRVNGSTVITSSSLLSINTWYTATIIRSSGILRLYINDTQTGYDYSDSNNYAARPVSVGCRYASTLVGINGYISELEISKGIARSIIVPTIPFKPDSYTKLLLHMDGSGAVFADSSNPPGDNGFQILPDGVTVTPNGTFAVQKMKDGRNVLKFDGSTNYISLSDNTAWDLNNNNFSICAWVKLPSAGQLMLFDHYESSTLWTYCFVDQGRFCYSCRNGATMYACVSYYGTFNYDTWYFVTCVISNYTAYFYVNGIPVTVTVDNAIIPVTYTISGTVSIGWNRGTTYSIGNIKDLQIFKGKALTVDQIAAIMDETFIY